MIGKVILGVLAVVVLLLAAALMLPVRLRFSCEDGELRLSVRCGPVRVQLFPPKKKETPAPETAEPVGEADEKPENPAAPPAAGGGAGAAGQGDQPEAPARDMAGEKKKGGKKKFQINLDQILYSLDVLPPILGRALRRTCGSLRIEPLRLYVLVAGEDPADTAMLYGRLAAGIAAALPALERAAADPDIQLYMDFTRRRMELSADVGVSVRPIRLVWIVLRAGGSLLKWFMGFRRLASPKPKKKVANKEHEAA